MPRCDFVQDFVLDFPSVEAMLVKLQNTTWLAQWDTGEGGGATEDELYWHVACEHLRALEEGQGACADPASSRCYKSWNTTENFFRYLYGDILVMGCATFFGFMIIYCIALGDAGYSSGYPDPFAKVYRYVKSRPRACWRALREAGRARRPTSATAVPVMAAVKSVIIGVGDEADEPNSIDQKLQHRARQERRRRQLDGSVDKVLLDSSISVGRSLIIACDGAPYVAVPLVRVGNASREVTIHVETVESASKMVENVCTTQCRFGREYGPIRTRRGAPEPMYDGAGGSNGGASASTLTKPEGADEGRAVAVTFGAGSRLAYVYVDVLQKSDLMTEDCGVVEFGVRISHADAGTAMGPVRGAVVRLINTTAFPSGYTGITLNKMTHPDHHSSRSRTSDDSRTSDSRTSDDTHLTSTKKNTKRDDNAFILEMGGGEPTFGDGSPDPIGRTLSPTQHTELKDMFEVIDTDHSGCISIAELKKKMFAGSAITGETLCARHGPSNGPSGWANWLLSPDWPRRGLP